MKKYFKKSLSLFMAALMLMSCWVFFAPETAWAVNSSGNYTWRLYVNCYNSYTGNEGWYTITGKTNNGRGSDTTIASKWGMGCGSGSIFDKGKSGYYPNENGSTSTAFPYKFQAYTYKNSGPSWGWKTDGAFTAELQVKKSDGSWVTICSGDSGKKTGHTAIQVNATGSSNFPAVNSTSWVSAPTSDLTISGGTATVSRAMTFNMFDQYGVRLSSAAINALGKAPTAAVSGSRFGTIGTDSSKNIYYAIDNSGSDSYKITVYVKSDAKSKDYDSQTITVNVTSDGKSAGAKSFTLYDPQYTFSFNGNGGSISPNASVKKYYYNTLAAEQIPSSGTRTGYEFLGVYADAHLNYAVTKPAATAYGNRLTTATPFEKTQTWYAAWWAKNVNVKFVDNMGNVLAEKTGKYDKNITDSGIVAPAEAPFKSNSETGTFNYTFTGNWKVIDAKQYNADGTQSEYQGAYGTSSSSFKLQGDTVFQAVYEKSKKNYTVTFYNENGGVESSRSDYVYRDQASCAPLSKATDNYFTYTFKGWHKVEYKTDEYGNYIIENGKYVPADGEQKNAYIVNENSYLSTSETSDEADAVNRFVSVAGDDDFTVRSDAEFVPVFEKTYNEYTVTLSYKTATSENAYFNNEGKTYHFGDTLGLPEVPDSYTLGGYRYPLTGFTKNGADTGSKMLPETLDESVTTHTNRTVNYVATYGAGVAAQYNISFTYKRADGTDGVHKINNVPHGKALTAPQVPSTYRDAEYEYTFSGWLDQDGVEFKSPAYKDAQYTAQYTAKKLYTVTFMNEGEEFGTKAQYVAGDTIVMPTENPTKAADKTAYKYTFKEWVNSEGTAVTVMPEDNLVLEASYTPSYIDYVINFVWKDASGNDVTDTKTYHYGAEVTIPKLEELGQTTYKDNTYNYTFKGWDTDVSKHCLGEGEMNEAGTSATLTYTATYRRAYNYYTVKWMQESHIENGKPVYAVEPYMTDAFIYNEKVRIPTVPPQSKQSAPSGTAYSMVLDYWYYVDGAGNTVTIDRDTRITGEIKAYPVYKETAKVCKVTFFDDNGISLGSRDIAYNTNLDTYNGIGAPAKAFSDTEHFRFDGWVDKTTGSKVTVITEDCSLQATYTQEAHTYGEIVADKLPTFFEEGYGTQACTGCAKTESNVAIPMLVDDVEPTAKLFIKDASYVSGAEVSTEALRVAPKNNLIIATVDKAEVQTYNENGKGSGTGKIEYFVSEGSDARDFAAITDSEWKLRFSYDEYVDALRADGLTDDEIKLAMSEFEANATAYVGDLANSYPEIVKDGSTFIFYAKITDRKGNVNYVRSQPLTMDATAPVITAEGFGNGGSKFCEEVKITVHENNKIKSLTVNGVEYTGYSAVENEGSTLSIDTDRCFNLTDKGVYTVAVTDESGNVTEKTVEILGSHTEKKTVTAPTCTDKGKTAYTCTVCGKETRTADETPALGHDYKFVKTVKKTCTEKGYDLYRCTRCGLTEERNVQEATGVHTYGDWIVTKKQTCSTDGSKYRVCSECGETETQVIEKDGVSHVYYRGVVTKPTCTTDGYTTHTCKYCNHSYTDATVGKLGHAASGVWVITKEASCQGYDEEAKTGGTVGERVQYCKRDGAADCQKYVCVTEEIPVPGHSWTFVEKVAPTATEQGYTLYKCANCDAEKKTDYTDKLEQHTVTFYGEDGTTEIKKLEKYKGETVLSTDAAAPEKAADKTYKYTFSHWALKDDAENKAVEFPLTIEDKDIALKAVYTAKYINYTIIFYTMKDGTPVQYKKVGYLHYDAEPQEIAGPSDYEDEGATYKFAGWYPKNNSPITGEGGNVSKSINVSEVTFNSDNTAEFVAYFEETAKKVNFTYAYNAYDGSIIYTAKVDYGTDVNVKEFIPAEVQTGVKKAPDAAFHYTFSNWAVRDGDASVKPLRADGLAIARFTATAHTLVDNEAKKSIPATCTAEGTSYKKCSVCGYEVEEKIPALGHDWGEEVDGVHHCKRCDATKESDTRYVVKFYIEGEEEALRTVSDLKYGADITSKIPTPTKADNGSKTYTFKYWYAKGDESKTEVDLSEALRKITGNAEYVAFFEESTKMVKVIYRVDGSTEALQVTEVEYGTKEIPEYTGVAPTSDKYDDYGHYVWYKSHPWSVEQDEIPAEGITGDLIIKANFVSEDHDMTATMMHNATCTEPMTEKFECTKCAYTYTKKTGKPLGHNFTDLVERVEPEGEKAGYEIYKCTRCNETRTKVLEPKEYINFVVTVVDTKGNPVEGAKVSIFDGETFIASNVTNAEGKVTFRVEKAKKYRVVIEGPDFDTVYGDITVNPDGSVSGNIPQPNVKTCSCTCHRNGLWPAIFRFFHKIIKMLVGEFVCCGNPDPRYYK